jgi:hypothetical protein
MPKTIVLLDVDDTIWLYKQSKPLNEELIKRLKTLGVTDLFLFTDMTLSNKAIQHRLELIKILENLGFRVNGVITPGDIMWNTNILQTNLLSVNTEKDAREYVNGVFSHNQPGTAFSSVTNERANGMIDETIATKSIDIARTYIPYLTSKLGYSHLKGLLFEFFLNYLSEETEKIIVIDDNRAVIKSIKQVCENKKVELQNKKLHVDIIHIAKNKNGLYYSMAAALQVENLQINHFHHAILLSTIVHEINRIQGISFCSKGNKQSTLNGLQQLLDNLHINVECKTAILTDLKKASLVDANFLKHVTTSISLHFNNEYSLVCQRSDVQKIIKEISRLRYPLYNFSLGSKKVKADLIENALLAALKNGCEDVTQDRQVRQALEYHRVFSFWGLKNTTAILNVDKTNPASVVWNSISVK